MFDKVYSANKTSYPVSLSYTGQQSTNLGIRLEKFLLLKVSNQGQLFSVCMFVPGSFLTLLLCCSISCFLHLILRF